MSSAISRQKNHIRKAERKLGDIEHMLSMVDELENRRALSQEEQRYREKRRQERWECQRQIERLKLTLYLLESESK